MKPIFNAMLQLSVRLFFKHSLYLTFPQTRSYAQLIFMNFLDKYSLFSHFHSYSLMVDCAIFNSRR